MKSPKRKVIPPGPAAVAFGHMIKEARQHSRLTLDQLLEVMVERGGHLGLKSKSAVFGWENATQLPRPRNIQIIADALQIEFESLKVAYNAAADERGSSRLLPSPHNSPQEQPVVEVVDIQVVEELLVAIGPLPLETVIELLRTRLKTVVQFRKERDNA